MPILSSEHYYAKAATWLPREGAALVARAHAGLRSTAKHAIYEREFATPVVCLCVQVTSFLYRPAQVAWKSPNGQQPWRAGSSQLVL